MSSIYLDNNATTFADPAVRDEMLAWIGGNVGNPSSIHTLGQEARRAIDKARYRVARLISAQPEEIIFTSGGSEANNLAILGSLAVAAEDRPSLVTSAIEHQSVLNPCRIAAAQGRKLTILPVDQNGMLLVEAASSLLNEDTAMVSVMLANNDVGTLQPVSELAKQTREHGVILHTDAIQAVGKIPVNVMTIGADLLSVSGHKLHGPQGVGALYVRRGTRLQARTFGGHQERGLRPGTENIAAIAGFGIACELAAERLQTDSAIMATLRDTFEAAILNRVSGSAVNGGRAPRLPNTTNFSFEGINGEALVINLDLMGLAASTGAACSSIDDEPSHVLVSMGLTHAQARSSVRFSFGRSNTNEEVIRAVELVAEAVDSMRGEHV